MSDWQAVFDAMSGQHREVRSRYHLTLGQLTARCRDTPNPTALVVVVGADVTDGVHTLGGTHSYRGFYSDLAFTPVEITDDNRADCNVRRLLGLCLASTGVTFQGWKGGDYIMDTDTALWLAHDGDDSGLAIMDTRYNIPACRFEVVVKQVSH
ncbi:MAG: hypothetical protein OXI12_06670 [Gammaproteobacteria bacterium]|nr:hypothetical protein [Gammaproteobacteria bacterium]